MDKKAVKALFQGKKGKIFLAVAAFVAIIAFVAYRRNKAGAASAAIYASVPQQTTPTGTGTSAAAGGVSADQVGQMLKQLEQGTNDKLKQLGDTATAREQALVGAVNTAIGSQNAGIASIKSGVDASLGSINANIGSMQSSMGAQLTGYQSMFGGLSQTVADLTNKINQGLAQRAVASIQGSTQKTTYDTHDTTDYNSSNPFAGNAAATVVSPWFGNGGADYNTASPDVRQSIQDTHDKLQSDPSFRQSELARADEVIAHRQADHLDTSEQMQYKADIQKMSA